MGLSHLSFCLRRAEFFQHIHVAVVRRHAVHRQRPKQRARRLLVHHRPGDDRQIHAAVFLGRLRRPQAGLLRLVANRLEPIVRNIFVIGKIVRVRLERQHVFVDEGARSYAQILDLRRKGEVHPAPLSSQCLKPLAHDAVAKNPVRTKLYGKPRWRIMMRIALSIAALSVILLLRCSVEPRREPTDMRPGARSRTSAPANWTGTANTPRPTNARRPMCWRGNRGFCNVQPLFRAGYPPGPPWPVRQAPPASASVPASAVTGRAKSPSQ